MTESYKLFMPAKHSAMPYALRVNKVLYSRLFSLGANFPEFH